MRLAYIQITGGPNPSPPTILSTMKPYRKFGELFQFRWKEALGKPEKALEVYTQIKDNYPKSSEASDIEKYIARVQK